VIREVTDLDRERRRLASLEGKRSASKTSSRSRKKVEKIRRIEVQFVDAESLAGEDGSGPDTDRIM